MNQKSHSSFEWIFVFFLCAGTAAAFWPVLQCDFINLDDPDYVTDNRLVKAGLSLEGVSWAFTTGHAGNWHPVTWLSHMLDVSLFGMKSSAHHAVNLSFHLANGCLLLLLLHRMTSAMWRSFFVAALFALHPLHVESVAWVSERKDVLSTFFGLLSLLAYVRYSRDHLPAHVHPPFSIFHPFRSPDYWLALIFLALGLMSKAMLVTWPFVMLLLDFWPLKRVTGEGWQVTRLAWRALVVEKIPFFCVVLVSCVVTFLVQQQGGSVSSAANLPLELRLSNAVASYWKYIGKVFWPDNLAVFYPHPELRYPISEQWPGWVIVLSALALVGVTMAVWNRRSSHPFMAVGWFWFLGTLVPVIGVIQVGTQGMADRYAYLPLTGLFILVVWGAAAIFERRKSVGLVFGVAVVCVCALLSWRQAQTWKNDVTLFTHALRSTSNNAFAHSMLGKAMWKEGEKEKAFQELLTALNLSPFQQGVHNDIAVILFDRGEIQEAVEHYQAELSVRPSFYMSHFGLAAIYSSQGEWDKALYHYKEVVRYRPDYAMAHDGMGFVLFKLGRMPEAEQQFREALSLDASNTNSVADLGRVLALEGRYSEAETVMRIVVDEHAKPEFQAFYANILYELGQTNEAARRFQNSLKMQKDLSGDCLREGDAFLKLGAQEAARVYFTIAVRLDPASPDAAERLGSTLAVLEKLKEAITSFELSAQLRPDSNVYYRLGLCRLLQGKAAEARTAFENAIKLAPDWGVALNELAWLLATDRDGTIRDGALAVALAEKACRLNGEREARFWGTLDAAYAEVGRFDDAIRIATKTEKLALSSGSKETAEAAIIRLNLYKQGKPFRQ